MRKISLVLTLVALIMVLPGLGYLQAQAVECSNSYTTQFPSGSLPASGRIAQSFSTLRASAGAATGTVVDAPAEFTPLAQTCVDGFSWVQLTYTSGTTSSGASAVGLTGWALESQLYSDGTYGPGRWLTTDAAPGATGDCKYSYATDFEVGVGATTGEIADVFSTLRSAPGAAGGTVVDAPATFDVLDQGCYGGFSWVQITYTSGTTSAGKSAVGLTGWALESQIYYDGTYGPGTWLEGTVSE
ncbi:MAG: hypothetical protein K8J31_16915 [Anaerolineae bacterium]|nr:hypothetical protein [Anaerolineae bacterium]